MNNTEQQILETWQIHNRAMIYFIENLPAEALSATLSTRGGRDIGRQLAHLNNVRYKRLTAVARRSNLVLTEFDPEVSPSKKALLTAFRQSGEAMEEHIRAGIANEGKSSNFKRGVVPMIGYYISHESHHRGHAVLTMKQSGITIPDKLRVHIWEWNKI